MTRGFDDRKDWASVMHRRYIAPAVAAYWDVDDADVQALPGDAAARRASHRERVADAVVRQTGDDPVYVAERVRPLQEHNSSVFHPDFSIREHTSTGDRSELHQLLDAYRSGDDLPETYVFGVGSGTSRNYCAKNGLTHIFWIDSRSLIASVDAGDLEAEQHQTGTGELTRYYSVDDLRAHDCVRAEASGSVLQSAFDDHRSVEPDFPSAEGGVRASRTRLQDFA